MNLEEFKQAELRIAARDLKALTNEVSRLREQLESLERENTGAPLRQEIDPETNEMKNNNSKELAKSFGKNLKAILLSLGLTQCQIAERSGLSQGSISLIMSGNVDPLLSSVLAILSVVPCSFESLVKK